MGRLKIPTTRSAHSLVALNRNREAMDLILNPRPCMFNPDPETLNSKSEAKPGHPQAHAPLFLLV